MDCHRAIELVPDYVVDTLSAEDRAALQRHLDGGCLRCRQELDEVTAATSLLGEALDPINPRPELKTALLDRIENESQIRTTTLTSRAQLNDAEQQTTAKSLRLIEYFPYIAATLLAIAAGSLVANVTNRPSLDASLVQVNPRLKEQWQRRIATAEQAFGSPRAQIVGLSASSHSQFQAAIFYDRIAKQLHVVASQVPQPSTGMQPYLWLLDENGRVLVSNPLKYVDLERAAAIIDLPRLPMGIARALITYESPGNPSEPKGPVVRGADLQQTT